MRGWQNRRALSRCDRADRVFVELGGSNRFCTFKLWYGSGAARSFIKAQFNFVEKLCFQPLRIELTTFMNASEELVRIYPEAEAYFEPVSVLAYDPREIVCEKIRAILTRRGIKARDFIDLYMLKEKMGLNFEDELGCTTDKISFMLDHYLRYRENMSAKKRLLDSGSLFEWGDERDLLLVEIDQPKFYSFVELLERTLRKLSGL